MSNDPKNAVKDICGTHDNDKLYMMDILREVQDRFGCVSDEAIDSIAESTSTARVLVDGTVSFYSFLSKKPKGKIVIRLCDDIVDRMSGFDLVAKTFKEELGIEFGETTSDGTFTLERTPCIGMCDQAPAAMVNSEVITNLHTDLVPGIVKTLRDTGDPKKLVHRFGERNNAHPLVKSMVNNNIRGMGEVIFAFADFKPNAGLERALSMSPVEVINEMTTARLRGRGGAGFPAGMKWQFTRQAEGDTKYIICNADEGEPGTFKDRVVLTELPDRVFEGMTVAGYAIGAANGILYLRGEYAYLFKFLENILEKRREAGLLGKNVMGKQGFDFDIRLQIGAGAYICGEETALISSCEGERGDPKNRPPFPAQEGYLKHPTCVNNVETFCAALRIMEKGAGWFQGIGTKDSAGTKLLSVSGDCQRPGVYEYAFGLTVNKLLEDVGAEDAKAVQVGGPSGQLIGPDDFGKRICYEELATGGSIVIFGPDRNILDAVHYYMEFFVDESCGYCTPCRAGNSLLKHYLEKVMAGKGEPADLDMLKELGEAVKLASRCGLGQTSPNPILTSMDKFRPVYDSLVKEEKDGFQPSFDIHAVLAESSAIAGRKSVHFTE